MDAGGLFREFFTLVFKEVRYSYFESTGTVKHNWFALKVIVLLHYTHTVITCLLMIGQYLSQNRSTNGYFLNLWC